MLFSARDNIRVNDYTPFSTSLLSLFLSLSHFFLTLWMMVFFLKIINEKKKEKEKEKEKENERE